MYADPKTYTEMSGHSIKIDFGIISEQGNNIMEEQKKTILISNKEINCRNEKWKQFTRLPEIICYSYICMLQLQRMEANQNLNEIRLLYPQT